MDDVEIVVASALCLLSLSNYINILKLRSAIEKSRRRRRRKRRWWTIAIHRNRTLRSMENFFQEESGEFINFCRISRTDFEFLLNKIEPIIKKQTKLRTPIPPKIRLAITLRYLATGDSYRSLHYLFKVSAPAISLIVPQVCKAINTVLKDEIKLPQIPEQWLAIEEGFRKKFPRCVNWKTHSNKKFNKKWLGIL